MSRQQILFSNIEKRMAEKVQNRTFFFGGELGLFKFTKPPYTSFIPYFNIPSDSMPWGINALSVLTNVFNIRSRI